jgi:hypothetical protein
MERISHGLYVAHTIVHMLPPDHSSYLGDPRVNKLSNGGKSARLVSATTTRCQYFEIVLPVRAHERNVRLTSLDK